MVMKQFSIAIFDLDNTVIAGDCELLWVRYLFNLKMVDSSYLAKIDQFFIEYADGTIDYPAYVRHLLIPFKGLSPAEAQNLVGLYLDSLRPLIRLALADRLAYHQREHDVILLATSSINILVEPVARMLGIDNVVCTIAEVKNEVLTGNYVGELAFGRSKVNKVKLWIEEHHISLDGSWGYSDSLNDLPLLLFVQNPVAVFPDPPLKNVALTNRWMIIDGNE